MSGFWTEIPPKAARALRLTRGEVLRITDIEGQQVADLVAFDVADPDEYLSQGFTRSNNQKVMPEVGDQLYSNLDKPLLTIVEDTVGVHDMLFPPCSRYLREHRFGIKNETGCREHLAAALEPYGIGSERVTDPFNAFMNARVSEDGTMEVMEATSRPGDYVDLRAEADLIVAVSACASDFDACNGWTCTAIGLSVL
jgi:uncharacterized protein